MSNEHKSSADALTAILGPSGRASTGAQDDRGPDVELQLEESVDPANDDLRSDGAEAALEVVEDLGAPADDTPPPRTRRNRSAPKPQARGGRVACWFGIVCLIGGIALTVLDGRGRLPESLSGLGLDASILLAIGTVAYVTGALRRQTALAQVRIDTITFQQQEAQLDMQANLQYLVEQQVLHAEKPPAQGEELERVLMALQRQDEKVNNLSRALKMYGKPLMEIANQGADIAAQQNQLKGHVEALLGSLQQGFTRVENAARNQSVDLGPLEKKTAESAAELRRSLQTLGEKLPTSQAVQQLQQQLVRVEASVQATSQRLDDSEVRKSLVRLEDASKLHGKKIDELAQKEWLHRETQRVERQLDTAIGKVGATVEQVRSKNLGAMESSMRDIQRELSGVATSVAYIQQAVKGGTVRAAAPSPATPATIAAPTPVTATPTTAGGAGEPVVRSAATAPPTPAADTPTAAPNDTAGLNDAQSGVAQNRTGTRAASSKNVLGAIAKLKKLKG